MTGTFNRALAFVAMLMVAAGCAGEAADYPREQSNLIEYRLVQEAASDGSQVWRLDDERLNLGAEPIVTDADIRAISPVVRSAQLISP